VSERRFRRVSRGERVARRALQVATHAGLAAWHGAVRFANSNDLTYASSIAYYALLSLFPFFLLVLSVLGAATASEAERAAVLDFVLKYFPTQFDFVTEQLDAFRRSRVPLGLAGFLLISWSALGVFGAVTTAINYAWGVEKQHTFFKHKLVSFVMLVAAGLLMLLALLLVSASGVVRSSWFAEVMARTPALEVLGSLTLRWASTALFVVVVGLVFYFVPNVKVRFRDVWIGALLTGLLWRAALWGFSWWVRDLSRFSLHGSIAAVVVFLLWVYVSAVILLYGVEYTAAYARLRRHRGLDGPVAPPRG
jgi:membrane protein